MKENVLKGDRESCLATGMDDQLAKPIDRGELGRMRRQWLGRTVQAST